MWQLDRVSTCKKRAELAFFYSISSPFTAWYNGDISLAEIGVNPVSLGKPCLFSQQCEASDPYSHCVEGICSCLVASPDCSAKNPGCHKDTFQVGTDPPPPFEFTHSGGNLEGSFHSPSKILVWTQMKRDRKEIGKNKYLKKTKQNGENNGQEGGKVSKPTEPNAGCFRSPNKRRITTKL